MEATVHNPDRYMGDLRQILAQGRKRIGVLLGAGGPASILVDASGKLSENGEPLIPTTDRLTQTVVKHLDATDSVVVSEVCKDLGLNPNVEMILSRIRSLAEVVGGESIYEYDRPKFAGLAKRICESIGNVVQCSLPEDSNPYTELAGWIAGADRTHAIEVFTPNYDLLMEEALERREIPYFDGFSGSFEPFFDPASISTSDDLPAQWVRLWKLHGSLGWDVNKRGGIIRGKGRKATQLIYPEHLKYDQIQKLPFSAFFDRLRKFLASPDTLLMTCGFSFSDRHIVAVIDEALKANPTASVFAFQFGLLKDEERACALGNKRPNMSVYGKDGAIISCIRAPWAPGEPPSPNWEVIRASFWKDREADIDGTFLLGNFASLARFVSLTHAERVAISSDRSASEVTT
jgi:hypothetical protein